MNTATNGTSCGLGVGSHPCAEQIEEIGRLSRLLAQKNVLAATLDIATVIAFNAMNDRGEVREAHNFLLDHVRKVASANGLS